MSDVYAAIEAIAREESLPTAAICDALEVSRSAYYAWFNREPGLREQELDDLTPLIVEIFVRHRRRYGSRRIAEELTDRGQVCSAKQCEAVRNGWQKC